ncbi:MAG: ABC transporter permease [Burkholderiales bacterium PBB3]|nr:MAG: ABC transporter permease [Burkholderiales bacterium PBB3]
MPAPATPTARHTIANLSLLTWLGAWLRDWWQLIHLGAVLLVLALSPSSYRAANRPQLARHIYNNTAPILLGFSLVCALITVVLTRIVLTTALSYGLTQYALQVLIRVLVLELIPLTAALFVALRCTIPDGAEVAALQSSGALDRMRAQGQEPMRAEVLPRVVAGLLAGITLASLSSVVALVVAYLVGYGFTLSGLPAYTRMFGQVFSPAVCLILVVKTVLFSMAVSLIPMASALYGMRGLHGQSVRTSTEMHSLVRMFALVLLIEVASLVGNYY